MSVPSTSSGSADTPVTLPPLAGFSVKALTPSTELTLTYSADMAVVENPKSEATGWLKAPATRAAATEGCMLITASAEGRTTSALLSYGSAPFKA